MPWSKHDLLLKKKYPCKLQVLFFSLLLKLLQIFLKSFGEIFLRSLVPFCFEPHTQNKHPSLWNSLSGRQPSGSWLQEGDERRLVMIRKEPAVGVYGAEQQCREPSTVPHPPFHPVLYLADDCSKSCAVWLRSQRSSKHAVPVEVMTASTQQIQSECYPRRSLPCFQPTRSAGLVVRAKPASDLLHICFPSLPDFAFLCLLFPSPLLYLCGNVLRSFLCA